MRIIYSATIVVLLLNISQLWAQIPFNEASGTYEVTIDEFKEISPFWGIVAIHGGLLKQIRFYGNYKDKQAQDPIAELIAELFPSPDGLQMVANARSKDAAGNLSEENHRAKISDIIKLLWAEQKKSGSLEVKEAQKGLGLEQAIAKILKDNKSIDQKRRAKPDQNESFAKLIANAFFAQDSFANPLNRHQQLYPKNIVIISLLSFFASVANEGADFANFFMMNKKAPKKATIFDKKEYQNLLKLINQNVNYFSSLNLEELFLMGKGFDYYGKPFIDPVSYSADPGYYGISADCSETTIRNIFMGLSGKEGVILEDTWLEIKNKIVAADELKKHIDPVVRFFKKYPHAEQASMHNAHAMWAQVISRLNTPNDQSLNAIAYRYDDATEIQVNPSSKNAQERARGLFNVLNVIAKLMPDEALTTPWAEDKAQRDQQAEAKLTRFCDLFSTAGHRVSWQDEPESNGEARDFRTIVFIIEGTPAYKLCFDKDLEHIHLRSMFKVANDWRIRYQNFAYPNVWLEALYSSTNETKFLYPQNSVPISAIYNKDLASMHGAIQTISGILFQVSDGNLTQFMPFIEQLIAKSLPIHDEEVQRELALLFHALQHSQVPEIRALLTSPKYRRLEKSVKEYSDSLVVFKICFGSVSDILLLLLNRRSDILQLSLCDSSNITDEGIKHLSKLESLTIIFNDKDNSHKITDKGIKHLSNLKALVIRNADEITDESLKHLPNLNSLRLQSLSPGISDDFLSKRSFTWTRQ